MKPGPAALIRAEVFSPPFRGKAFYSKINQNLEE